jgi:hypothetical protein
LIATAARAVNVASIRPTKSTLFINVIAPSVRCTMARFTRVPGTAATTVNLDSHPQPDTLENSKRPPALLPSAVAQW